MTGQHPDLTLTYFDTTGRAEPIRLALTIAGVPFKDERVSKEQWPRFKFNTPFGQLPVLKIDGEMFAQSNAILHYAGRLSGLYPKDPLEALTVDMLVNQCEDTFKPIGEWYHEQDSNKKKEIQQELLKNKLPNLLSALDKYIGNEGSDFAVSSGLTIADLVIYCLVLFFKMGAVSEYPADIVEPYKNLNCIYDKVANHPRVKEWNQNHPKNQ